jgi:16S rRNA (guanine527-N7)-methyltransferase
MEGMELILHYFPDLTEKQIDQFSKMQGIYEDWNAKINVISRKDISELYLRHVLHGLAIAKFIQFVPGTRILDIGTGGGFPGIPLAVIFPECEFLLTDSIAKKITVVNAAAEALELTNVKTHAGRVERVTDKFDFIVSRAVAPLDELVNWTKGKFIKQSKNEFTNGWICLKGGDLVEEATVSGRRFEIVPLQKWFKEDFFESKRIIYAV